MADMLIKGMEMRDYPQSITINPDGSVVKDTFGLHRPMDEWKAAVLPDHGRLVDADKILAEKKKKANSGWEWEHAYLRSVINSAPTVLEATNGSDN